MGWPYPRSAWERRDCAEQLFREQPERLARVTAAVVQVLADGGASSQRKLREAVREVLGRCTDGDVDAAVEILGASIRRGSGPRGATRYGIDLNRLPVELRRYFAAVRS
jgi:hypothetical protein